MSWRLVTVVAINYSGRMQRHYRCDVCLSETHPILAGLGG